MTGLDVNNSCRDSAPLGKIDFEGLSRDAAAAGYIQTLYPHGERAGREWQIGDINGASGHSFNINLDSGKWIENSGDGRGDLTRLVAEKCGLATVPAALEICADCNLDPRKYGIAATADQHGGRAVFSSLRPVFSSSAECKKKGETSIKPLVPPADSWPKMKRSDYGEPILISRYYDPHNWSLAFIIARYQTPPGIRKLILPFTYGESAGVVGWHNRIRPGPRPVLGLMELRRHLDAKKPLLPGLVVEGEKAYETARRMVGDKFHVFTWHGGARAVELTDWRILDGLPAIYLWPDNDDAGRGAMTKVAEILGHYSENNIHFIPIPSDAPEGWDAADAESEGRTII